MSLTRRRFLTISAAAAAAPAYALPASWQGRAFGGDVSIRLDGPRGETAAALQDAVRLIRAVEAQFNLFDENSALSHLNRDGVLRRPDPMFVALMRAAGDVYRVTSGLFDPSIQPLWRALALGQDPGAAKARVGWDRVQFDEEGIELGSGQALSFNGIAQGFATDLVADMLHARGFGKALVNIGEHRALGGPWRLGLSDPEAGYLGNFSLQGSAVATSSPSAMRLGEAGHILHPSQRAIWSTVSVEAQRATYADAYSTALCMAQLKQIDRIKTQAQLARVSVVNAAGELVTR